MKRDVSIIKLFQFCFICRKGRWSWRWKPSIRRNDCRRDFSGLPGHCDNFDGELSSDRHRLLPRPPRTESHPVGELAHYSHRLLCPQQSKWDFTQIKLFLIQKIDFSFWDGKCTLPTTSWVACKSCTTMVCLTPRPRETSRVFSPFSSGFHTFQRYKTHL